MTEKTILHEGSPLGQVPAFTELSFSPKKNRYAVCVFLINEGERIRKQLDRMQPFLSDVDLILGDGGSTDGSLEPEFLQSKNVRTLLTKKGPGKLSAQMRMALAFALAEGYEGVVVVDGNNKDNPASIPHFVKALDEGYDHVQGSRFVPGGREENTPLSRRIALRLIHAPTIRLASGFHYTDTTNGFRAYSRTLLEHPGVQPFRDCFSDYELHYYLAIRAARLGLKVKEVPVERIYPPKGKTPTKISPLRGNMRVLGCLFRTAWGKYNPEQS